MAPRKCQAESSDDSIESSVVACKWLNDLDRLFLVESGVKQKKNIILYNRMNQSRKKERETELT